MCFLGCTSPKDSVNLSLLGTLSSVEPQNVHFACFYNTKKCKFYVLNSLNWYGGEMRLNSEVTPHIVSWKMTYLTIGVIKNGNFKVFYIIKMSKLFSDLGLPACVMSVAASWPRPVKTQSRK